MSRAPGSGRHLLAVVRIAPDRRIDSAARVHDTPHQRDVLLFDLAIAELARQLLVCSIVLCHNHQPRRAAIQTMDDPWPQLATHSAQILDVMQQRVDQRSTRMASAWMNDHSRRLVEYGHIAI